jgi:hypothetical protein
MRTITSLLRLCDKPLTRKRHILNLRGAATLSKGSTRQPGIDDRLPAQTAMRGDRNPASTPKIFKIFVNNFGSARIKTEMFFQIFSQVFFSKRRHALEDGKLFPNRVTAFR